MAISKRALRNASNAYAWSLPSREASLKKTLDKPIQYAKIGKSKPAKRKMVAWRA